MGYCKVLLLYLYYSYCKEKGWFKPYLCRLQKVKQSDDFDPKENFKGSLPTVGEIEVLLKDQSHQGVLADTCDRNRCIQDLVCDTGWDI